MKNNRLITEVLRQHHGIVAQVEKLEQSRYPTQTPILLAKIIRSLSQKLIDSILVRYETSDQRWEQFCLELQTCLAVLRMLGSHLRFIDRSTTKKTPWSLIGPLERLGRSIHPNAQFIIRPQWIFNYSICDYLDFYRQSFANVLDEEDLRQALTLEGKIDASSLYVITFPYLERLNILLHTLIGHELGHPIEKAFFREADDPQALTKIKEIVISEVKSVVSDPNDLFEVESKIDSMFRKAHKMRERALAEIACDLVCVNIFGPAAIFALEEFAKNEALDVYDFRGNSRFYPPWRFRLRCALSVFPKDWIDGYVENIGVREEVKLILVKKWENIIQVVEDQSDIDLLSKDISSKIAYDSVAESLPKLKTYVNQRLAPLGYGLLEATSGVHQSLLERLEHGIPPDAKVDPSGTEEPSDLVSIINTSWIRYLCIVEEGPSALSEQDKLNEYFVGLDSLWRLTLKAIEYAELRNHWTKFGGEIENGPSS